MARKPRGFDRRRARVGRLYVRRDPDGGWVVLASPPDVKIDNKHRDRRPHLHPEGWISGARIELREDLTLDEVIVAIRQQLMGHVRLDPAKLVEDLA